MHSLAHILHWMQFIQTFDFYWKIRIFFFAENLNKWWNISWFNFCYIEWSDSPQDWYYVSDWTLLPVLRLHLRKILAIFSHMTLKTHDFNIQIAQKVDENRPKLKEKKKKIRATKNLMTNLSHSRESIVFYFSVFSSSSTRDENKNPNLAYVWVNWKLYVHIYSWRMKYENYISIVTLLAIHIRRLKWMERVCVYVQIYHIFSLRCQKGT